MCLGSIDTDRPEEVRIVRGDLFGKLESIGQTARIGRLLAPLVPPNILAVGLNYGGHAEETKISRPEVPVLFLKATTSVIGPDEMILLPSVGPDQVDYEAELAVIIGRRAKNVSRETPSGMFWDTPAQMTSAHATGRLKNRRNNGRGARASTPSALLDPAS